MPKSGIALVALFLGLAIFQGARGLFVSDPALPPPPPPAESVTPSQTPSRGELEPLPRFEGPVPEAKAYSSTEELAAALEQGGITCETLQFLDQPDPTLSEFSLCDPGTETRRFNIYFYETPKSREMWLRSMETQRVPQPLVWGPNWIIVGSGDPETAHQRIRSVQGALGGTVEDFAPKKA